jgi:hypothetical protein
VVGLCQWMVVFDSKKVGVDRALNGCQTMLGMCRYTPWYPTILLYGFLCIRKSKDKTKNK